MLNSNTLMIMKQGINENNLLSGGTIVPETKGVQVHMGVADS